MEAARKDSRGSMVATTRVSFQLRAKAMINPVMKVEKYWRKRAALSPIPDWIFSMSLKGKLDQWWTQEKHAVTCIFLLLLLLLLLYYMAKLLHISHSQMVTIAQCANDIDYVGTVHRDVHVYWHVNTIVPCSNTVTLMGFLALIILYGSQHGECK